MRGKAVSGDIEGGGIWSGDIAPYPDRSACCGNWGQVLCAKYGTAEPNRAFWASVSRSTFLNDLSRPVALHQSETDDVERVAWFETVAEACEAAGHQPWSLHLYPADSCNISNRLGVAVQRSTPFFDRYVKCEGR